MVVWAGLSNSQSIGYSYTTISKRLKVTTLNVFIDIVIHAESCRNDRKISYDGVESSSTEGGPLK